MVYDCFLFFNEWEVLEIRLNELDPYVDVFVLVEATETFKGKKKELYFEALKEKFSKFSHKLIHLVIDKPLKTSNPWEREYYQRDQISRALKSCDDGDIIFMSDVDEIPRQEVIPILKEKAVQGLPVVCEQQIYRYFLNREDTKLRHEWIGTVATTYSVLKAHSPQWLRDNRSNFEIIKNAGWHFTAMGGYGRYVEKIISFSHTQNEFPIPSREEFAHMVSACTLVPIDDSFPSFVRKNLSYLESLFMIDRLL